MRMEPSTIRGHGEWEDQRRQLARALKKTSAIFVSAGGYPKISEVPHVLLTEESRDKIVAALEGRVYSPTASTPNK